MKVSLKETWLGLRNSTTRIPFRYGPACLTSCPQAILAATIEIGGKRLQTGYAGDCLPPSWFDKSPQKDFQRQIEDMLAVIGRAQQVFADEFARPQPLFSGWLAGYEEVHAFGAEQGFPPLLSSFGVSMVERAMMDAMARAAGLSLHQALRENIFAIVPGEVHPQLAGHFPADWLPDNPRDWVWVRHTVGLGDPLAVGDIPPEERLGDGYPQALEEYVEQRGVRYFKLKVSSKLEHDLERLRAFAAIVQRHRGDDYRVTLDGNEQYTRAQDFQSLIDALLSSPELAALCRNILVIEQPLARDRALSAEHFAPFRDFARRWPIIIDESDGELDSYAQALALGYRGASSKNCKGPIKSVLNAGLTWAHNAQQQTAGAQEMYVMTGEDLCSVGIVPVQADLALAAALGLEHVERNGHHYHPGLSYLPRAQQQAALAAHGDFYTEQFYTEQNSVIRPHVADGKFHIRSLQCPGFGFAVEPDLSGYAPAQQWKFESLNLHVL